MRLKTLIQRDLSRGRKRFFMVATIIAFGVASIFVLASLGLGVHQNLVKPLMPKLPVDLLRVEPKLLGFGMFAFDNKAMGGGLDQAVIERLKAHEGVQEVHEVVGAAFPLRAQGGAKLIGRGIRTDLFATGVSEALVKNDVASGYEFKDPGTGGKVVPVLVARRLLDLYNATVAQALGQPRLTKEAIIGFSAEIVLGSSYVRGTPDPSKVKTVLGQIVGFSDQATLVGITVPEATIRRWNKIYGGTKMPIVSAYVRPKSAAHAGAVTQAIEEAGLKLDETQKLISAATTVVSVLAMLIAFGFVGLASFSMAQTFNLIVTERRYELATLRALGARQKDVFSIVILESVIIAFGAGVAGVVLGLLATGLIDQLLLKVIGEIPFRPDSFVAYSATMIAAVLVLACVAGIGGALLPPTSASRRDPVESLRA